MLSEQLRQQPDKRRKSPVFLSVAVIAGDAWTWTSSYLARMGSPIFTHLCGCCSVLAASRQSRKVPPLSAATSLFEAFIPRWRRAKPLIFLVDAEANGSDRLGRAGVPSVCSFTSGRCNCASPSLHPSLPALPSCSPHVN